MTKDLFCAALTGDIGAIEENIAAGVDVNALDERCFPAIAYSKNYRVVKLLIDSGAYVTGVAPEVPVVHNVINQVASGVSDISALKALLELDRSLNSDWNSSNGDYAIHAAVRTGCRKIIQAVVDAGADLNLLSNDGESAYSIAAGLPNLQIINFLLELAESPPTKDFLHVNVSAVDNPDDLLNNAFLIVDWAIKNKKNNLVEKLIRLGVNLQLHSIGVQKSKVNFFTKNPEKYRNSEFTPWFTPEIYPARAGVYQVKISQQTHLSRPIYSNWNENDGWSDASAIAEDVLNKPHYSGRSWFWRGLIKNN